MGGHSVLFACIWIRYHAERVVKHCAITMVLVPLVCAAATGCLRFYSLFGVDAPGTAGRMTLHWLP